ncbi:right-handed parallel beta-helix repeat-containing protein [Tessaracoccus sp. MC1679]|uniref:right-handed parallel beta-helix repeat-containing protein n=1 Tax=Tessaracoccus sp. MC1679 TaxID=2760313 RepID=UPI001600CCFE|nr:right-handed parallel beta-helix repeat-containing protein [Tessaracoccus sp. MC1679]MBB1516770.1 right-handed parallel beta-helix repeat-containing protein [Tessaracoccus sp. MC1679]
MGTTTHRFLLSIGASVGVLALASAGLPASAADPVACGDTITTSTTLTQDLVCNGGDGLKIGANGIVLDLGGHSIDGGGVSVAGVRIDNDHDVTVRNGSIAGFSAGVEVQQSQRAHVYSLDITPVTRGINIGGGGTHLIEKNIIHGAGGDGIRVAVSTGNVIAKNTVTGNVWGISIADWSSVTLVEKNVATGNRHHGLGAFSGATGTSFIKNIVSGTRDNGIVVGGDVSGSYLEKNTVSTSRLAGILVNNVNSTLVKNVVVDNVELGIEAVEGVIGSGNLAAGNNGGVDPQCTGVVCLPYV